MVAGGSHPGTNIQRRRGCRAMAVPTSPATAKTTFPGLLAYPPKQGFSYTKCRDKNYSSSVSGPILTGAPVSAAVLYLARILASNSSDSSGLSPKRVFTASRPWPNLLPL
jgi:hypothetical protein